MSAEQDKIRDLAYRLWQEAGSPHGRDQEFWFAAEQQLKAATAPKPKTPAKPKAAKAASKTKADAKPKALAKSRAKAAAKA